MSVRGWGAVGVLFFAFVFGAMAPTVSAASDDFGFSVPVKITAVHDGKVVDLAFEAPFFVASSKEEAQEKSDVKKNALNESAVAGLSTHYAGLSDEQLRALKERAIALDLTFSLAQGAQVKGRKDLTGFRVIDTGFERLAEVAYHHCRAQRGGAPLCAADYLEVWNKELKRAYRRHGGANNATLKQEQQRWQRSFEQEKQELHDQYAQQGGSEDGKEGDNEGSNDWKLSYQRAVVERMKARIAQLNAPLF